MKLEEAIEFCEIEVKRMESKRGTEWMYDLQIKESANRFRQLAEWLKELRAYRDGCHCDTCKYSDKNIKNRPCGYCGDNESNWEYGGEVNADDSN